MRNCMLGAVCMSLLFPVSARPQSVTACQQCMVDAASSLGSDVAVGALTGALGGGLLGPGAVCGAVGGALAGLAANVKDVLKCQPICKSEAAKKGDGEASKCDDLPKRLQH
jgi:hypothetical protein